MPARRPQNFSDVIALWPTTVSLSRDTGYSSGTIRGWQVRNWLPEDAWDAIIAAAEGRRFRGVTIERLRQFQAVALSARAARREARREAAGKPPPKGARNVGRTSSKRRPIGRRVDRLDEGHPGADAGLR